MENHTALSHKSSALKPISFEKCFRTSPAAKNGVGAVQSFRLNERWATRSVFLRSCQAALFSASRR